MTVGQNVGPIETCPGRKNRQHLNIRLHIYFLPVKGLCGTVTIPHTKKFTQCKHCTINLV